MYYNEHFVFTNFKLNIFVNISLRMGKIKTLNHLETSFYFNKIIFFFLLTANKPTDWQLDNS